VADEVEVERLGQEPAGGRVERGAGAVEASIGQPGQTPGELQTEEVEERKDQNCSSLDCSRTWMLSVACASPRCA
jgi:hypothetical protein